MYKINDVTIDFIKSAPEQARNLNDHFEFKTHIATVIEVEMPKTKPKETEIRQHRHIKILVILKFSKKWKKQIRQNNNGVRRKGKNTDTHAGKKEEKRKKKEIQKHKK